MAKFIIQSQKLKLEDNKDYYRGLIILEEIINYPLPNLYKLMLENLRIGYYNLPWERFFLPKKEFFSYAGYPMHRDNEQNMTGLFELYNFYELKEDWETYGFDSSEYEEYKMIRIGGICVGGGLFIGLEGDRKEKIYYMEWGEMPENPLSCAENIFTYLRGLTFIEDKSNLGNIDHSQLYQTWGKGFWQVKGDDTVPIKETMPPYERYGFVFINLRPLDANIDLNALKSFGKITFPFKFRTFLEHFEFIGETGLILEKIYDEKAETFIHFEKAIFPYATIHGEIIEIGRMWDEKTFLDSLKDFRDTDAWQQLNMWVIGTTTAGHQIGVVMDGEHQEEVWLLGKDGAELNDNGDKAIRLAEDIFKFIRGIEPIYQEEYLGKIYKKWGEDFWRIKGG